MAVKDQFVKLKENWLLIVLFLVLILFLGGGSNLFSGVLNQGMYKLSSPMMAESMDMAYNSRSLGISYDGGGDFAPEEEERKITKSASMSTRVDHGKFDRAERDLKSSILVANGIIISENVHEYGMSGARNGNYQIKIQTDAYETVVEELKAIGEVISFNENAQDVTGRYINVESELETERARLVRYQRLYTDASKMEDRINLEDRIFNQERRIKYLEENLENIDRRITYTTISVSIQEEESNFATITFVRFSELVKGFVSSLSGLLVFVVWVLPWAIVLWIVLWIRKLIRGRGARK